MKIWERKRKKIFSGRQIRCAAVVSDRIRSWIWCWLLWYCLKDCRIDRWEWIQRKYNLMLFSSIQLNSFMHRINWLFSILVSVSYIFVFFSSVSNFIDFITYNTHRIATVFPVCFTVYMVHYPIVSEYNL